MSFCESFRVVISSLTHVPSYPTAVLALYFERRYGRPLTPVVEAPRGTTRKDAGEVLDRQISTIGAFCRL